MADNIIDNKLGFLFQLPLRIGGYLLMAAGLVVGITGGIAILFAALLFLTGAFFAFSLSGVKINTSNRSVKQYTRIAFFDNGKYRDYSTYPNVCIIKKKKKNQRHNPRIDQGNTDEYLFEIHLVSKSFRGKALLNVTHDHEKAQLVAEEYSQKLGTHVVPYRTKSEGKGKIRNRMHTD